MSKEKVIIILCDTLRAKSLPHYGNKRNTTPNLNPIIDKDFIVYSRAYAPSSWTPPSHISLFTGLYPLQAMETVSSYYLHPIFKTLPELFRESGYKTFAFSTNELVSKKFGFGKGFDAFLQMWLPNPEKEEIFLDLKGRNDFERVLKALRLIVASKDKINMFNALGIKIYKRYRQIGENATPFTNRTMRLLKKYISENSDKKVFCFVNLMQTHFKYNPPPQTRNRFTRYNAEFESFYNTHIQMDHYVTEHFTEEFIEYTKLLYEEEVSYLDIVISDFIRFLKDSNLYETCTLIITSDHGEHFGENGRISHSLSVYEPLIKIPLYIKWYGKSENNNKIEDKLVMLQDLYSTFINLLNHYQPCPESSFDLKSSDKRSWIMSQLPDMSYIVKAFREKNQNFSLRQVGLEDYSLSAYVFSDGIKIVENGKNVVGYDLKNDQEEKKSFCVPDEYKKRIERIKNDFM